MVDPPDVVGLLLERARDRLTVAGVQVRRIRETRPPKGPPPSGPLRVIALRRLPPAEGVVGNHVELVVAREVQAER